MKKLNLKNLHVRSFVTSLEGRVGKTEKIVGGTAPGFICPAPTFYCTADCEIYTYGLDCQPQTPACGPFTTISFG